MNAKHSRVKMKHEFYLFVAHGLRFSSKYQKVHKCPRITKLGMHSMTLYCIIRIKTQKSNTREKKYKLKIFTETQFTADTSK